MGKNEIIQVGSFKEQFFNTIKKGFPNTHFSFLDGLPKFEMSYSTFSRKVKKEFDITPQVFLREYRLSKALELLGESNKTISTIAEECGFNSMSYFNRTFKEKYSNSPTKQRESNKRR